MSLTRPLDTCLSLNEVLRLLRSNDESAGKAFHLFRVLNIKDDDNPISYLNDQVLIELASALQENKTIREFRLEIRDEIVACEWTQLGENALVAALREHPLLERFFITFNAHCVPVLDLYLGLMVVLSGKARIHTVILNNHLPDFSLFANFGTLISEKSTLAYIEVNDHYKEDNPVINNNWIEDFCRGLAGKPLKIFKFYSRRLTIPSVELILQTLRSLSSLFLLEISIGDQVVTDILHDLQPLLLSNNKMAMFRLSCANTLMLPRSLNGLWRALLQSTNLKILDLNGISVSGTLLRQLAVVLSECRLSLKSLRLNHSHVDDEFIEGVIKVMTARSLLRKMAISSPFFTEDHFKRLAPVLADETKCQLDEFDCYINQPCSSETFELIKQVVTRNKYIFDLPVADLSRKQKEDLKLLLSQKLELQRQSRSEFIDAVITMWLIYFSSDSGFRMLPKAVFNHMLQICGRNSLGMTHEQVAILVNLVMQNLDVRRTVINNNSYNPSKDPIHVWWCKTTCNIYQRPVFVTRSSAAFFTTERERKLHHARRTLHELNLLANTPK